MTAPALRTRLAFRHGRPVALLFAEHGGFARESNEVRFWRYVEKTPGCWLWRGGLDKDGYGKFSGTLPPGSSPKQRHVRAARYAWELVHDRPFPAGRAALRTCGERRCVRPDHLAAGTFFDCGRKGVKATGERNGANTHPEKRLRGRA